MSANRLFWAGLGVVVCTVLWTTGCSSGYSGRESYALPDSIVAALRACARLKEEMHERDRVILKLTSELDRTLEDLDYVEKQFIALQRGIRDSETKASAVAALAEAKLAYDTIVRSDPGAKRQDVITRAKQKIETSDELLSQDRYAASVYLARRALNLLTEGHGERNIRIVAVAEANIRNGPGLHYAVLDRVAHGTILVELEGASPWYKVRTVDGRAGWIHESVTR